MEGGDEEKVSDSMKYKSFCDTPNGSPYSRVPPKFVLPLLSYLRRFEALPTSFAEGRGMWCGNAHLSCIEASYTENLLEGTIYINISDKMTY